MPLMNQTMAIESKNRNYRVRNREQISTRLTRFRSTTLNTGRFRAWCDHDHGVYASDVVTLTECVCV